jgi:ubiquinone/menaquinone biosynthesis C-methylase UbiE
MVKEYYKTKESVKEYIELAKEVNGLELINELRKVLAENSLLLEIGSGPGTDWQLLSNYYDTIGSDFSEEFLKHQQRKFPTGDFLQLDASTLETDKTFDGIYSNKVLHHLTDDELTQSITRQAEILKKDGVVCLSFWKGEGTETFKGMFVNYHTESELKEFFEPLFEILSISNYEEFEANDSLLLIAKRK